MSSYTWAVGLWCVALFVLIPSGLKRYFVFVALLWMAHFNLALSSLYLEVGTYVIEQQDFTFHTGASLRLAAHLTAFWGSLAAVIAIGRLVLPRAPVSPADPAIQRRIAWAVIACMTVVMSLLFLNLVLTGPPLLSSVVTRNTFWRFAKLPFLNTMFGNVALPVVIACGTVYGVCHADRGLRRASLGLFLAYLVYALLLGNKYSLQMLALAFFVPSFMFLRAARGQPVLTRQLAALVIVILASLLGYVTWIYASSGLKWTTVTGSALAGIGYRVFALEGHMWWGVDYYVQQNGTGGLPALGEALRASMHQMMSLVAPPAVVDTYIESGTRFTTGYPAIFVYIFGHVGAFVAQLVAGALYGGLLVYTAAQILRGSLVTTALAIFLVQTLSVLLSMGELDILLSSKFLMTLTLLSGVELARFVHARRRRILVMPSAGSLARGAT